MTQISPPAISSRTALWIVRLFMPVMCVMTAWLVFPSVVLLVQWYIDDFSRPKSKFTPMMGLPVWSLLIFCCWSLVTFVKVWWHAGRRQIAVMILATQVWAAAGWACLARWYGEWDSLLLRVTMLLGGMAAVIYLIGILGAGAQRALGRSTRLMFRF